MTTINLNGVEYISADEVDEIVANAVADALADAEDLNNEDLLFVKVYDNGKVTAFRTMEEANNNKTSPRASRRLVIDISEIDIAHDWQEVVAVAVE